MAGLAFLAACLTLGLASQAVAAEGRSIAFVSNADPNIETLARGWVGQRNDIEYILTPSDLDDLAEKLISLGRARKIASLLFIGHGGDSFFMFMKNHQTGQGEYLNAPAARRLAQRYPALADAFAPDARVVFLACNLGQSNELLRTVGGAFLRTHGGTVVGNRDVTRFEAVRDLDGIVLEWIDHPDRFTNPNLPSSWTSATIEPAPDGQELMTGSALTQLQRFAGTWNGTFTRQDTNATGPLSTTFVYDGERRALGGWHYEPQYVMRDVKVSGNTVTFWHETGACRTDHTFTALDFAAKRARSTYRVTCPDGTTRAATVEYR